MRKNNHGLRKAKRAPGPKIGRPWRNLSTRGLFSVDADRDEGRWLAAAQNFEQNRRTARLFRIRYRLCQCLARRYGHTVGAEDHVTAAQALSAGIAAAADSCDDETLGVALDADAARDRGGQRLDCHAEPILDRLVGTSLRIVGHRLLF